MRGKFHESTSNSSFDGKSGHPIMNYENTVSSTANRMYMDALLETKRFEEYFTVSMDLMAVKYDYPFQMYLFMCFFLMG